VPSLAEMAAICRRVGDRLGQGEPTYHTLAELATVLIFLAGWLDREVARLPDRRTEEKQGWQRQLQAVRASLLPFGQSGAPADTEALRAAVVGAQAAVSSLIGAMQREAPG